MANLQPSDLVTTREAALILGVGTTSIKRWADRGQLPCVRTAGGHRRFSRAAVLAFRRIGAEMLGEEEAAADPAWIDAWIARLVGDEDVREVALELEEERGQRGSWAAVADALGAVLDEVGRRWAAGDVSVVEEHLLSARLARAAAQTAHARRRNGAPRALLAAAQGDDHSLALSLCELVLGDEGWEPVFIGARAPTAELASFIERRRPQMVLMSASAYSTDGASLAAQAERIGEACRRAGAGFIVGGRGHWPSALSHGHRLYRFSELAALLSRSASA